MEAPTRRTAAHPHPSADTVLLAGMPGRRRVLAEVLWLIAAFFGPDLLLRLAASLNAGPALLDGLAYLAAAALAGWALLLVRPWELLGDGSGTTTKPVSPHGSGAGAGLAALATLAAVTAGWLAAVGPSLTPRPPAALALDTPGLGEADWPGGLLAGVLATGAIVALLAVLVRRDGQGARGLGLVREGAAKEALMGLPALGILYAAHVVFTVVLAGALLTGGEGGALFEEAGRRATTSAGIASTPWLMLLVAPVGAVLEELAFRGFLLPRLRALTGRWWAALLVVALVFGAGHLWEGSLAVLQAAWIGTVLGLVFLWRRSVVAALVAHALFNVIGVLAMVALQRLGGLLG